VTGGSGEQSARRGISLTTAVERHHLLLPLDRIV
jgi:hypothetical protein